VPAAPIDSAFVEILPDFSPFGPALRRELDDAFRILDSEIDAAMDRMRRSFEDGTRSATGSLDQLGDVADRELGQVERAASDAAGDIGGDFAREGEQAERALREVGDRGEREFDRVEREARDASSSMGGQFRRAAGLIAAAFAAVQIGQFIGGAIEQAADLGESINAVSVVLGDGADSFIQFGEDAADSLGLTQAALNQAIVPMASLLRNAGLGGEDLSGSLQEVAQRATDVASVFNADVNEVLEAFGAAVRGETEPARRFGVNLNAVRIEAKALELGLADASGEVDQAAKTQAALALVLEDTEVAAGDFANTIDSWPNLLRRAKATLEETAVALGSAILPALQEIGSAGLPVIESLTPAFEILGAAIADSLLALQPSIEIFVSSLSAGLAEIAPSLPPLAEAFGVILQAVAPLIPVVASLASAYLPAIADAAQILAEIVQGLFPLFSAGAAILEEIAPTAAAVAIGFGAMTTAAVGLSRGLTLIQRHPVIATLTALSTVIGLATGAAVELAPALNQIELSIDNLTRGVVDDVSQQVVNLGLAYQDLLGQGDDFASRSNRLFLDPLETLKGPFRDNKNLAEELSGALDDLATEGQDLDRVLSGMARAGSIDEVNDAIDTLARTSGFTREEFDEIAGRVLPDTTAAMEIAARAAEEAAVATDAVATAVDRVNTSTVPTTTAFIELATAIRDSQASEEDAAIAAESLGIATEDLLAIAPEVATAFDNLASSVETTMPRVSTAVDDAFAAAEEAQRDFTMGDFEAELEEALQDAQDFNTNIQALLDAGFTDLAALATERGPEFAAAAADAIDDPQLLERVTGLMGDLDTELDRGLRIAEETAIAQAGPVGEGVFDGISEGVEDIAPFVSRFMGRDFPAAIRGGLVPGRRDGSSVGRATANALSGGLNARRQGVANTARSVLASAIRTAKSTGTSGAYGIGLDLMGGIASGIRAASRQAQAAMTAEVNRVVRAGRLAGDIASPSRKTAEEIGGPLAEGIGLGISQDTTALRAIDDLVGNLTSPLDMQASIGISQTGLGQPAAIRHDSGGASPFPGDFVAGVAQAIRDSFPDTIRLQIGSEQVLAKVVRDGDQQLSFIDPSWRTP
jgi:hypothetical protein